jgi:hypothetical protein
MNNIGFPLAVPTRPIPSPTEPTRPKADQAGGLGWGGEGPPPRHRLTASRSTSAPDDLRHRACLRQKDRCDRGATRSPPRGDRHWPYACAGESPRAEDCARDYGVPLQQRCRHRASGAHYKTYGADAVRVTTENPYRLAHDTIRPEHRFAGNFKRRHVVLSVCVELPDHDHDTGWAGGGRRTYDFLSDGIIRRANSSLNVY